MSTPEARRRHDELRRIIRADVHRQVMIDNSVDSLEEGLQAFHRILGWGGGDQLGCIGAVDKPEVAEQLHNACSRCMAGLFVEAVDLVDALAYPWFEV